MNADDDMEREFDEMAEALEATIRALVRAHPGIEVDDLAERATSELLSNSKTEPGGADVDPDAGVDLESDVDTEDLITDLVYS